jgi:hypothetical protein
MSALVEQFLDKPRRKHACGEKRTSVPGQNVLSRAFAVSSKENGADEKQVFDMLLAVAYQTPTGKKILDDVSRLGYSFSFEPGMNKGGCCYPGEKKITLSPECGFNHMLVSLVHEGRHAIQHSLAAGHLEQYRYQVADFYKYDRAVEADAVAFETAFTHELKTVYPAAYREKAASGFPMLPAYEKELEASGDAGKALEASFRAWYGCVAYRDYYDRDNREFIDYILKGCTAENDPTAFQIPVSSQEILKICPNGKRPYVDPGFLETPAAFSIPAEDKADIERKMKIYASSVKGASADMSVMRMYSRDREGNILPHSEKKEAAVAAFLIRGTGRRR